ncbi:SH3 domain-containing protein [Paenibacillus chartarius]|uniref:SH3 domain-containing protein n=1 Tax=Paenibacillus chartarius TaxID=747481 RepID=A0ABV6DNM5_9BACL
MQSSKWLCTRGVTGCMALVIAGVVSAGAFGSITAANGQGTAITSENASASVQTVAYTLPFHPYQIRTLETVELYSADEETAGMNEWVAPQILTVLDEGRDISVPTGDYSKPVVYKHWLLVQTWLGPRWILPQEHQFRELRDDDYELRGPTPIYDDAGNIAGELAPQKVRVKEKTVGNYFSNPYRFLIDTWLGPKWIYKPREWIEAAPQTVMESIPLFLPDGAILYAAPETYQKVFTVNRKAQAAVSDKRWRNWYHVQAEDGTEGWLAAGDTGWIKMRGIAVGKLKAVNKKVTVQQAKPLYRQPNRNDKYMDTELGPQTVNVKAQFGDWYQVETWLGLLWIDNSNTVAVE